MPAQTLPLRDIKSIVDVPDHSLWLLAALALGVLLLLGTLLIWLLRHKKGPIDRKRAEALKRLDALDFNDTKSAVYGFSLLGHFVTIPTSESTFKSLLERLEPYKFKKKVPALAEDLKAEMQAFIKEAHRG